ncbi:pyruvate dehydrogenase complex dihydrolipoamide acetyltransferase [soil metagenome]
MPTVNMPKLSDTMSEGTIASWKKKKGDKVEAGDVLAEIETDKATMEMEAFDDGILKEIYVEAGGKAAVGAKIALILADGETLEADAPAADKAKATADDKKAAAPAAGSDKGATPAAAPAPASNERVKASPLAKKIAAERGVTLSGVTGTGPGGRVVAADVPEKGAAPVASASSAPATVKVEPTKPGEGDTRVPLSNMRKTIADRLLASKLQNPHFYLTIEVDAAPLMRIRKELNSANEAAQLPKISVNDFVLMAVSRAAASHPYVNASWAGDSVIQYGDVNISVAIAVEDGLVTPVIRKAQKLSLKDISAAVKDLATRARSKKLKPEEYAGGTITVSNLGAYGIEQFFAIINPPQAAIIAVGAVVKKPVVNAKNEIVVGERMSVSLSGDHRVVDGAVGAEFLASLRKLVENPALLLF